MDTLDKGWDIMPQVEEMSWHLWTLNHTTFNSYKLFMPRIFHLKFQIIFDCIGSETVNKGGTTGKKTGLLTVLYIDRGKKLVHNHSYEGAEPEYEPNGVVHVLLFWNTVLKWDSKIKSCSQSRQGIV